MKKKNCSIFFFLKIINKEYKEEFKEMTNFNDK